MANSQHESIFTAGMHAKLRDQQADITHQLDITAEMQETQKLIEKQEIAPELLVEENAPVKLNNMKQNESKISALHRQQSKLVRSRGGTGELKRSVSGFDIGQNKSVGQFYSSIRQKQEGEKPNFVESEKMTGEQYVKALIKQQEERY